MAPPPREYILLPARKSKSITERSLRKSKEQKGKNEKSNRRGNELENGSAAQFKNRKSEVNISECFSEKTAKISENQLIPSPRTPKDPQDILRKSLIRLKCLQWSESVFALREIVQVSRFNPALLTNCMPAVYKGITNLLKITKVTAVRTACQTANELFINITPVRGLELEELVHGLLQKTGESNKLIRNDALEALDSLVLHVPPAYSAKVLLHKKITGFHLSARATAAKLLACIANIINCEPGTRISEEIKTQMVAAAVKFLRDDCSTIRMHGIRFMSLLLQQEDFNRILQESVSVESLIKINKIIQVEANEMDH